MLLLLLLLLLLRKTRDGETAADGAGVVCGSAVGQVRRCGGARIDATRWSGVSRRRWERTRCPRNRNDVKRRVTDTYLAFGLARNPPPAAVAVPVLSLGFGPGLDPVLALKLEVSSSSIRLFLTGLIPCSGKAAAHMRHVWRRAGTAGNSSSVVRGDWAERLGREVWVDGGVDVEGVGEVRHLRRFARAFRSPVVE